MRSLPSGTVTFLFSDIEGSTHLLRELGERYAVVLADQRQVLRDALSRHHGVEVDTQGDALFAAFADAGDAVAAAHDAQLGLAATAVRVRMGIHTGQPVVTAEGYVGLDVHRGARICAAGHGGQVLLSRATRELLKDGAQVRDLGEHRLKDLPHPEWLFQLVAPDLEGEFPPLRTLSNSNLPASVNPLVGRERELIELVRLLARDDVRLVTLTGPGGTGKTRLAIHVAEHLIDRFRNGVFFVSLAGVSDPDLMPATLARTLGVTEAVGESPFEAMRRYLQGRSMLLVLDNFEHLLRAAPEVAKLLALEPQLKMLVTSRERLHLGGEHEWIVAPLPARDAVVLFDARARAASGAFDLTTERDVVARICGRLDGLPLAIELAAARVKHLSAADLLARLDRGLSALPSGPADAPERQRSLRATIDWSYELLDAGERRALARLSVFSGGGTIDVVTSVCETTEDTIASLVDKSLLRRQFDRYLLLETIREYASECLVRSGDRDAVRLRHAQRYVDLAERGEGFLTGNEQLAWLARLESEHDNFRAGFTTLLDARHPDAVRLAGALWRLWFIRGHLAEGRRWMDLALTQSSDGATRAKALFGAAVLAQSQGDARVAHRSYAEALDLYRIAGDDAGVARCMWGVAASTFGGISSVLDDMQEALRMSERVGDDEGVTRCLASIGRIAWVQGDLETSRSSFEAALSIQRRRGDLRGIADSLNGLGDGARVRSDFAQARVYYEESLGISRLLGDRARMAGSLFLLGLVARNEGDRVEATKLSRESLAIARDIAAKGRVLDALGSLARLASDEGDHDKARSLLAEALTGDRPPETRASALSELGDISHLAGDDEAGARHQREALRIWRDIAGSGMIVRCVERLAYALAAAQAPRAVRLLGAAQALREAMAAPGAPLRAPLQQRLVDDCVESLRSRLGAGAFAQAWAEGHAMSRDEALEYALEEPRAR